MVAVKIFFARSASTACELIRYSPTFKTMATPLNVHQYFSRFSYQFYAFRVKRRWKERSVKGIKLAGAH